MTQEELNKILDLIQYKDIKEILDDWEFIVNVFINKHDNGKIEIFKTFKEDEDECQKNIWVLCVNTKDCICVEAECFTKKLSQILEDKTKTKTFDLHLRIHKEKECYLQHNCSSKDLYFLKINNLKDIKYKSSDDCLYKGIVIEYCSDEDLAESKEELLKSVLWSDHRVLLDCDKDYYEFIYHEID